MRLNTLFVFCLLILLTGCTSNTSNNSKTLIVAGSTTVLPIAETWAKLFYKQTNIQVNVQGGGSTNGIEFASKGHISLGMSSRSLNNKEKESLDILPLGKDALAVIVNKKNNIQNITLDQLRQIYTKQVTNWQEIGGSDLPIKILNRESGSGTRSCFEKVAICQELSKKDCPQMSLKAMILNSNAEVKKSVEIIEGSIGYISYGFVDDNVKAISVNNIPLSLENIYNNSYKLSRDLLFLRHKGDETPETNEFLEFTKTKEAQQVLLDEGFIPLNN